jgi:hypothetical protein
MADGGQLFDTQKIYQFLCRDLTPKRFDCLPLISIFESQHSPDQ